MNGVPFITVEGPIGIGKTSLAKAISEQFQMHLLKEIVDENPFLNKFYSNIEEWSFQTEMFFLCNRFKQLEDIQRHYLAKQLPVAADYHIFKNTIFAQRTLKGSQLEKYREIYRILTADMPQPNVVIYLHGSLETLQSRIAERGRDFEKLITADYLQQLSEDYDTFMDEFAIAHPDIPVLRFNGDELDFVNRPEDLTYILAKLQPLIYKGVQ